MINRHLRDIDRVGARTVRTASLRAAEKYGRSAVDAGGICVLTGPPGCGKTFAGLTICASFPNARRLVLDDDITQFAFQHYLLAQLRGQSAEPSLRGHLLEWEILDALRDLQPVLFVDNANYLRRKLIAQLLFLQAHADFGLILAGHRLNGILQRVEELETRTARTISFHRITRTSLVTRLGEFHDMFDKTDPAVLIQTDVDWAKGRLGRWARIIEATALEHPSALTTGLSPEVAERMVHLVAGSPFGRVDQD